MNDKQFLHWVADRMPEVNGGVGPVDFMSRLRRVADKQPLVSHKVSKRSEFNAFIHEYVKSDPCFESSWGALYTDIAMLILTRQRKELAVGGVDWQPTPDNINALPSGIRNYVHALETRCDPSGETQDRVLTGDMNKALEIRVRELEDGVRDLLKLIPYPLDGFSTPPNKTAMDQVLGPLHELLGGQKRDSRSPVAGSVHDAALGHIKELEDAVRVLFTIEKEGESRQMSPLKYVLSEILKPLHKLIGANDE